MTSATTIAVETATVLKRVNRKLARDGRKLFKLRSHAATGAVGPWFVVDGSRITDPRVELEDYARELEALAKWEVLA